ncbi:Glutathione import ATP-binding protein GsiA [Pelotomaculum schinkii]|uniref:Glutathione import ATP-binding protein GsiA n=1 Tax=Pelotomaculum schinkii TaxID=78350 RepID=A0A4Y7RI02_9FIRM|nr:ABC transporter ATP-binding protein [Pelotomaculum schinkii]TEB08390.1 Glutathione import ATP-binding protein GsiA [Pelotomaculum schinkii]
MLLDVSHLSVCYKGQVPSVKDLSFHLDNGEILAVVGESGSGKSTLLHAIIGLLPDNGRIINGSIRFADQDLTSFSLRQWREIRGRRIGYIFQDAGASLNPVRKIGSQFTEYIRSHDKIGRKKAQMMESEMLRKLSLHDGQRILNSYPSQLSGGMKQRVAIAMAMIFNPDLIIADEPTSALDTVSQAQIIEELHYLKKTFGTSVILVTHNINVAARVADKIGIMLDGTLLEHDATDEVICNPKTEYAKELLRNNIKLYEESLGGFNRAEDAIFTGENISKYYSTVNGRKALRVLHQVSIEIKRGEFIGIVGESGCGKSTLAKTLLGLEKPDNGRVLFHDIDIAFLSLSQQREFRRKVQLVFQSPMETFSPRMKIGTVLKEPLCNFGIKNRKELPEAVNEALQKMLLPESYQHKYPHELSGGELQRVSIARCLEIQPEVIIYDEPTSALDTVIQKQILKDILHIHKENKLTSIFISHDIALIRHISDRIIVMYRGCIVEILRGCDLLTKARHPYTKELLNAVCSLDREEDVISPVATGLNNESESSATGCVYYHRCCRRKNDCMLSEPTLKEDESGNLCACFFPTEVVNDIL